MLAFFSSPRFTGWLLGLALLLLAADRGGGGLPRWLYLLPAAAFYLNLASCLWQRFRRRNLFCLAGLAFLLFHLGLALVVAGGVLTALFRFEGVLEAASGQWFADRAESFVVRNSGPFWRPFFTGERFFLGEVEIAKDAQGNLVHYQVQVKKSPDGPVVHLLEPNRPLPLRRGSVFLSKRHGQAVLMSARDRDGRIGLGTVHFGDGQEWAEFVAPGGVHRLALERRSGGELLMTGFPGHFLRKKSLQPGESVVVDDVTLTYVGQVPWVALVVVRDPGKAWVYAGFALFVIGMILYYGQRAWRKRER